MSPAPFPPAPHPILQCVLAHQQLLPRLLPATLILRETQDLSLISCLQTRVVGILFIKHKSSIFSVEVGVQGGKMTLQLFSPPSIYCKKEEGNIVAVEGTSSAGKKRGRTERRGRRRKRRKQPLEPRIAQSGPGLQFWSEFIYHICLRVSPSHSSSYLERSRRFLMHKRCFFP